MRNNKNKKTWLVPQLTFISSGSGVIEGGGAHTSTEKTFSHRVRVSTTFGHASPVVPITVFNSAHS